MLAIKKIMPVLQEKLLQRYHELGDNASRVRDELNLANGQVERIIQGERGIEAPRLETVLKLVFGLDLVPELAIRLINSMELSGDIKRAIVSLLSNIENYSAASDLDQKMIDELLGVIIFRERKPHSLLCGGVTNKKLSIKS